MPHVRNRDLRADSDFLRHVRLRAPGGWYDLYTWDSGRVDSRGQSYLRYEFYAPKYPDPLFLGSDFAGSPLHAIDSDNTTGALLGFLTLRPGDTDQDYFSRYTPGQMDFAESSDAEYLQAEVDRRFHERRGRR
jgi:hypothetical protein